MTSAGLGKGVEQASELLQADGWELGMSKHQCNTSSFERCRIVSSLMVSPVLMQTSVQEGRPSSSFMVLLSLIIPSSVRLNDKSVFSVN